MSEITDSVRLCYEDEIAEICAPLRKEIEDLKKKIESMEEDVAFLDCLQAAGVDNWCGYEVACEMCRDDD